MMMLLNAGDAFDADGKLASEFHVKQVQSVIDQVLFASERLAS